MAKQDFRDMRYVWSPECGGCIMLQKRFGLEWKDFSSTEEGSYPTELKSTKEVVKWYNLQLRVEQAGDRIRRLQDKIMKQLVKQEKLRAKQAKHTARMKALMLKGE